ncbi:hypothetical protein DFH07DRAFT_936133 [Mycena maculata]|uniref:Uncharacterized protein n=1 Tax=Mycena maculata TaxID=230809 RepID=A0AAD7K813_9AGAR|nr:hypothetical protein DFH07DRAFT_936133 [Mycena maculata]
MVVTRKTPVAPVPTGSRTNSSQVLPRAAKAKTTSTLAESEPVVPRDSPAAKNAVSSQKPPTKSKHKNRHHNKVPKPSSGFLDQIVYFALFLLALYAFNTCPKDENLSNPVCRSLSQYRTHVLEPYVLPPIQKALSHPSVAPYVEKVDRLERETIRPIVLKTAKFSAPYAAKAKHVVWDGGVIPAYNAYVVPQWRAHVLPPWNKYVSPRIAAATPYALRTQRALENTAFVVHKTYTTQVQPVIVKTYVVVKPYAIKGYRTARPHAIALAGHAQKLGGVLAAKAGDARRQYVDPHVVRIWDKVLELSGAGPVSSPTEPAAPVPEESASTTEDSTTEAVVSETSVEAVVTPVEASESASSTPFTPAEEEIAATTPSSTPTPSEASSSVFETSSSSPSVPPPAETASTVPVVSASTETAETEVPVVGTLSVASVVVQSAHGKETLAAVEPGLSAASVAVQSAHGMESPVVEEILEDVKSLTEEPAAETLEPTPTLSAVTATPIDTEVPEPEAEEEDEMDDFMADLGLDIDEPEPEVVEDEVDDLTPAERHELQRREAEEQAEAKLRRTAEKRKDLEGRMAHSKETLSAMVKEKNKQLRKTLVGMRKAAVAKMDDPFSTIGGQLPALEKEGDKLLKGLEGYLKKDIKSNKGGDPVERTERWNKVVGKVEEKLQEKITAANDVIQQFHVELKGNEVNEGMAIIAEVKDMGAKAQADVGLELSWLADVTYNDWQIYHTLAQYGTDFQAEASEIQAGTHAHPPVDPFVPRFAKMQEELAAIVNVFIARIDTLKRQAQAAFAPAEDAPPVDSEGASPPADSDPEEPTVSILPIDTDADLPPPKAGDNIDPGQVVIGKSPQQVLEALRKVETPSHEEL